MASIRNNSMIRWSLAGIFFILGASCGNAKALPAEKGIDFSSAQVVIPSNLSKPEQAALQMLMEEVQSRTLIHLGEETTWPSASTPVIVVGTKANLQHQYGPFSENAIGQQASFAEGFVIKLVQGSVRQAPTLFIVGNDSRGMLFGVGYLLRKSVMERGKLYIPGNIDIHTHPAMALRGHQLGYRPKTNAYDGFSAEMWDQYIRDLIIFGTNSIELLPPYTDDDTDSPMFPEPPMDMMVKMDQIIEKYGLNAWIWYPMMYGDYSKAENVEKSLADNKKIFSKLPKIDVVFVPGGDPGHTPPQVMFNYLEKEVALLHQYHPNAQLWMSPQGFSSAWMAEFFQLLKKEPSWLTGIVYGPQLGLSITEFRKKIPSRYLIRRYPDITHSLDAQYAVPDWDFVYAATENRETINPRPTQEAAIFKAAATTDYYGFITYSEGVNDDINKMLWSGLGWNPQAGVGDILADYGRYFIGPAFATDFAQGVLDLEKNWEGSLLGNSGVYHTLMKFQSMEQKATPRQRLNWRFQQALYRAYYDAYDRSRLIYETQLEDQAMALLRDAPERGALLAMQGARAVLDKSVEASVSADWRQRIFELAEALFQSIHMQLSVNKYYAIATRRGANLDLIDSPLNDRFWLEKQFEEIAQMKDEPSRLAEIHKLVNWKNPGAGGFYDDLGDLGTASHLVREKKYADDPSFLESPFIGFAIGRQTKEWRVSWARYAQTLYGHPLKMRYTNLDTTAQYKIKVVYTGDNFKTSLRLMADSTFEIHPYTKKPLPIRAVEFDIPAQATHDGNLILEWNQEPGQGGAGRGNQVAEVWLIKKEQ